MMSPFGFDSRVNSDLISKRLRIELIIMLNDQSLDIPLTVLIIYRYLIFRKGGGFHILRNRTSRPGNLLDELEIPDPL
jgi:hypothetical protein